MTRSLIDFPARFCDQSPVQRHDGSLALNASTGSRGLAADVRYYGKWLRDEAERRVGHLFPKIRLENGTEGVVNFWIWARTVTSPKPSLAIAVPLIGKFLAVNEARSGMERVSPTIDRPNSASSSMSRSGSETEDKSNCRSGWRNVSRDRDVDTVRVHPREAQAGRLGVQLMAMVVQTPDGRRYMSPTAEQQELCLALAVPPEDAPDAASLRRRWAFESRRTESRNTANCSLIDNESVMCTFSDLVQEARQQVLNNTLIAGLERGEGPGDSVDAYADVVAAYLAFAVDKLADRNSTLATWAPNRQHPRNAFTRQAISMTWDYVEVNPFAEASGNFLGGVESIAQVLDELPAGPAGYVSQLSRDGTS